MKAIRFFALLLLSSLALSCGGYQYDTFATIDGTVVDGNGSPLEKATVTISPGGTNILTGADGTFSFKELERNKYTITAQKSGHTSDRKEVSTVAGETVNITLILR